MGRFFVTGDTHGDFNRIYSFVDRMELTLDDTLIILGDAGLNFRLNSLDKMVKRDLKDLNVTLLCIKGNHEKYPEGLPNYKEKYWNGGKVFVEDEFPNLLFAKDGEIYNFNGKKTLVIGGAYSVDKFYRLSHGWPWFEDEQPSDELKEYVNKLIEKENKFDYVLTHTCPISTEPRHLFMEGLDQSKIDKTTEIWLQYIADNIEFGHWYFGHFHGYWNNGTYTLLFNDYEEL